MAISNTHIRNGLKRTFCGAPMTETISLRHIKESFESLAIAGQIATLSSPLCMACYHKVMALISKKL